MAGGTDKEPFSSISLFPEHGVKPVRVPAFRAVLKFVIKFQALNIISHQILLSLSNTRPDLGRSFVRDAKFF